MKLSLGLGVNSTVIFRGVGSIVVVPSLSISAIDSDSVDYSTNSVGTFYWLLDTTATHTAAEVELGGGDASGSFAVVAGSNTEAIDLSAVGAGDYKFHAVVKDGDGDYSTVVTDDLTIEASASQVTVTEFDEQTDAASKSSYAFTLDLTAVPDGARCIVAFSARDVTTQATTISSVSATTHTVTSILNTENNNGSNSVPVGFAEFTKQAGVTSDTITWTISQTANVARHWGAYLENAHATTVDSTATGSSANADSVTTSTALTNTNLGVVISALGSYDTTAQSYTVSPAGFTEHRDDNSGHNLVIASWPTDGTSLTPTMTSSLATTDILTLAAIAIPPA